jgi:uncharacterized protein YeaO (DUF488 family)
MREEADHGDKPDVRVRRAYDEPKPDDGTRVLVDRIWPRGLTTDKARLDLWFKQVAPSTELRKWYSHDPERFEEFGRRYREELKDAERAQGFKYLRELANSERDADAAHRDQACQDQRGCRARRPDQGLSRAVLVSTIGCTPACSTSKVSSPRRRGCPPSPGRRCSTPTRGNGRRQPASASGSSARSPTECRHCGAGSAERRRWPCWRPNWSA